MPLIGITRAQNLYFLYDPETNLFHIIHDFQQASQGYTCSKDTAIDNPYEAIDNYLTARDTQSRKGLIHTIAQKCGLPVINFTLPINIYDYREALAAKIAAKIPQYSQRRNKNYYLTSLGNPFIAHLYEEYRAKHRLPVGAAPSDEQRLLFELSLFNAATLSKAYSFFGADLGAGIEKGA